MDEIKRLFAGTVTNTEQTALDMTNGAVLKTIMIGNENETEHNIKLIVDSSVFLFDVEAKKTLIIDNAIVCNILKMQVMTESEDVLNVHISGIQLGGA